MLVIIGVALIPLYLIIPGNFLEGIPKIFAGTASSCLTAFGVANYLIAKKERGVRMDEEHKE